MKKTGTEFEMNDLLWAICEYFEDANTQRKHDAKRVNIWLQLGYS